MEKSRKLHWAWIIFGICWINLFVNYSARLGYGVILPEMIHTLGFGRAAVGTIYNFYIIVYVTIAPFTGYLTDRFGARRVITTCLLLVSLGIFLMGTVTSLWTGCFFFAIAGLGSTGMWAPVAALVQRWVTIKRRGITLGVVSTGYGLGLAMVGAVFPWVVDQFSWRHAWFFLGGMALVVVPLNAIFLRSDPESIGLQPLGQKSVSSNPNTDASTPIKRISLRPLFKDSRFWLIALSYFAVAYSLFCVTTFMVDYAEYQLGLTKGLSSRLATVHGIGQVIGVLTVLPLSDSLGRKKTILISNSLIAASMIAILLVGKQVFLLYLVVGCVGIAYGTTFPIYGLCAGDYFPRDTIATVVGAWTPFYGCGAILTHWISGILRDTTGLYNQAFIISAIMAFVGLLLISRVRKLSQNDQ
ncbi:MAG: MFS transporter [Desulfobacterales bacterium]|jgi:sugar phosphate permease